MPNAPRRACAARGSRRTRVARAAVVSAGRRAGGPNSRGRARTRAGRWRGPGAQRAVRRTRFRVRSGQFGAMPRGIEEIGRQVEGLRAGIGRSDGNSAPARGVTRVVHVVGRPPALVCASRGPGGAVCARSTARPRGFWPLPRFLGGCGSGLALRSCHANSHPVAASLLASSVPGPAGTGAQVQPVRESVAQAISRASGLQRRRTAMACSASAPRTRAHPRSRRDSMRCRFDAAARVRDAVGSGRDARRRSGDDRRRCADCAGSAGELPPRGGHRRTLRHRAGRHRAVMVVRAAGPGKAIFVNAMRSRRASASPPQRRRPRVRTRTRRCVDRQGHRRRRPWRACRRERCPGMRAACGCPCPRRLSTTLPIRSCSTRCCGRRSWQCSRPSIASHSGCCVRRRHGPLADCIGIVGADLHRKPWS